MEIERHRIGAFDAVQARRNIGRKHAQRTIGAVDVKPDLFAHGQVSNGAQGIDGADVDRAGGGGDKEGLQAGGAVLGNRFFEQRHVDFEGGIHRDDAQGRRAQACQVHGLRNAAVRPSRGIGHKLTAVGRDAILAHRRPEHGDARDPNCDQVGHGRAGHEQAACLFGKTEHLAHPLHDLALDLDRNLVAPAQVGIEAGGQHLGQHADGIAAAVHPAHEAGVAITDGIGQDVIHEALVRIA